ncbi:MAG: transglutaminase domain-containing protein, partial [Candidatus Aenigmarchaeota archaeon]|nr:transglutaminase domain-containing protein [Candidatus Aenigmarchaeota archaeon]
RAYSLVQVVKTSAQPLGADAALDSGSEYTAETSGAQITANISATAYPFPRTLAGVAGMASWVHGYLTYDRSVFGLNKPSDWVLASRRGVCVEYSNLLAAMLRSKGIAARYANGYAYSTEDNSLIGHEWIEVGLAASTESPAFGEHRDSCLGCSAAEPSGAWVGFDPTWLEGGFIDATHMKTSISKDGVEKETLSYLGNGDLDWQKNPESVELLNYSAGYSTAISIEAPQSLPLAGGGYVKATISYQGCTMAQLRVSSCTNQAGREILHVQGGTRNLWLCGSATAFWAFTTSLAGGYAYSCPVLAYDQSGAEAERTISISGGAAGQQPAISGPDSAGVNKPFTIQTSPGSRLFSTELGEGTSPWTLTLMEPGTYHFYAYANGQLAQKPVEVRSVEEFELTAAAPASVNQTRSFIISAALRNIGSSAKAVTLKAVFGNQTQEQQASIDAGQSQTFAFNLTAYDAGTIRYTISAMSDSYTGYSGVIDVIPAPPAPKGILDLILDALKGMMDWLAGLFGAK